MDPLTFVYTQGMKSKTHMFALGLLLLPMMAQRAVTRCRDRQTDAFPVSASPTRWRDGYIDWKGRKIFEPDWRMFEAENGAIFVVDMKSIAISAPTACSSAVVASLVAGEDFEPKNLISFTFNCKDFVEVVDAFLMSGGSLCKSAPKKWLAIEIIGLVRKASVSAPGLKATFGHG